MITNITVPVRCTKKKFFRVLLDFILRDIISKGNYFADVSFFISQNAFRNILILINKTKQICTEELQ